MKHPKPHSQVISNRLIFYVDLTLPLPCSWYLNCWDILPFFISNRAIKMGSGLTRKITWLWQVHHSHPAFHLSPLFWLLQVSTVPLNTGNHYSKKNQGFDLFHICNTMILRHLRKNKEGDKELTDWERGRGTWSNNKNALDTFFDRTVFCYFVYRDWALLILAIL